MKLKSTLLIFAALLIGADSFAQLHVSTGTKKYVLLEEATGTWCGYCPDGAQRIEQAIKGDTSLGNWTNVISWHGPSASHPEEPMPAPGDPLATNSNYDSLGYPSAVVDRAPYSGMYSQNRGYWATAVGARKTTSANFQVDMKSTYDTGLRLLTVTVTGKALAALTGKWALNVFVVEDSVSSAAPAYAQHSYMYSSSTSWYYNQCLSACPSYACSSCAILPDTIYAHMQVARAIMSAGGYWGDTVFTNPASGTVKSKTYTYNVPAGYNAKYMKVIGLVQKYGGNQYDRAVENSITAKLRLMPKNALGIKEGMTMKDIELFPNPTKNMITVRGRLESPNNTRIAIFNATGQSVISNEYPANGTDFAETIQLGNIPSGVYFMHIINNGETLTERFTILK